MPILLSDPKGDFTILQIQCMLRQKVELSSNILVLRDASLLYPSKYFWLRLVRKKIESKISFDVPNGVGWATVDRCAAWQDIVKEEGDCFRGQLVWIVIRQKVLETASKYSCFLKRFEYKCSSSGFCSIVKRVVRHDIECTLKCWRLISAANSKFPWQQSWPARANRSNQTESADGNDPGSAPSLGPAWIEIPPSQDWFDRFYSRRQLPWQAISSCWASDQIGPESPSQI